MTKTTECGNKVPFESRQRAMDAAMNRMRKYAARRSDTNVYKCPYCGKWHVGHAPGKRRKRR